MQGTGDSGHTHAQTAFVTAGDGPDSTGEVEVPVGVAGVGPGRGWLRLVVGRARRACRGFRCGA